MSLFVILRIKLSNYTLDDFNVQKRMSVQRDLEKIFRQNTSPINVNMVETIFNLFREKIIEGDGKNNLGLTFTCVDGPKRKLDAPRCIAPTPAAKLDKTTTEAACIVADLSCSTSSYSSGSILIAL